jgi:SHS2 domain-containing protein
VKISVIRVIRVLFFMQRYREIEHTADVGVEIYGRTLEELFRNAGYALFNTIVEVTTVQPVVARAINVSAPDAETLLMNWLRELLYLCSVYQEVYKTFEFHSICPTELNARIRGEALDLERHRFETEIKAITYHQFAVVQHENGWQARVIFDV